MIGIRPNIRQILNEVGFRQKVGIFRSHWDFMRRPEFLQHLLQYLVRRLGCYHEVGKIPSVGIFITSWFSFKSFVFQYPLFTYWDFVKKLGRWDSVRRLEYSDHIGIL
jgi:hypothetical protein